MARDYLVKDIAFQAGLSTATVDRVINGRNGVRRQTIARVEAAIKELEQQENTVSLSGRTYIFDVVMEAPDRFSSAVRRAFEAEAAAFAPITLRSRFHFTEQMRDADLSRLMGKIRRRGSHGVVLKAPDTTAIRNEVAAMVGAGIAVVTLVTDLPGSARIAYAGSDNRAAGETAAYLIGSRLGNTVGTVLVTLSSNRFRGEEERELSFRRMIEARFPKLDIVEISEAYGKDLATGTQVKAVLEANADILAVYSIGGGNQAVLAAFEALNRPLPVFVAHDLDEDNLILLRQEKISYVLHHNLNADAASAYRIFLEALRAIPQIKRPALSALVIITPFNIPQ